MAFDHDLTDEEYGHMTQLQWLAYFYREPTGPGSQGGHDALFDENITDPFVDEHEQKAWRAHYDYVKGLPIKILNYITSDISIENLGKIIDAGEFSQLISEVPLLSGLDKKKWKVPVVSQRESL